MTVDRQALVNQWREADSMMRTLFFLLDCEVSVQAAESASHIIDAIKERLLAIDKVLMPIWMVIIRDEQGSLFPEQ